MTDHAMQEHYAWAADRLLYMVTHDNAIRTYNYIRILSLHVMMRHMKL